jgi:hypothetical protein
MRIEFTYTMADLKEAAAPQNQPRIILRRRRLIWRVAAWGLFTVVAIGLALLNELPLLRAPRPAATAAAQDLWTSILPSAVPAAWVLFMAASVGLLLGRHRADRRMRVARRAKFWPDQVLRLLPTAVTLPVVLVLFYPPAPVIWHPSRRAMMLVAAAPWPIVVAILGGWGYWLYLRSIRRTWESTPTFGRGQIIDFGEIGISHSDKVTELRYAWGYFLWARETSNLLLLGGEDGRLLIIPKRAFIAQEQLHQARSILYERISDCELEAPAAAFPVVPRRVIPVSAIAAA